MTKGMTLTRALLALVVLALLAAGLAGDNAVYAQTNLVTQPQDGAVIMQVLPFNISAGVGAVFEVRLEIQAGSYQVEGAQAYMSFNPKRLECLEVIPGNTLTDIFPIPGGTIDNAQGHINFAAGKLLGDAPSGNFDLLTARFRALSVATDTQLGFSTEIPRQTAVVAAGYQLPLQLLDGRVSISMGLKVIRLPLILRD